MSLFISPNRVVGSPFLSVPNLGSPALYLIFLTRNFPSLPGMAVLVLQAFPAVLVLVLESIFVILPEFDQEL